MRIAILLATVCIGPALGLAQTAGTSSSPPHPPVVVLDSWRNAEWATDACQVSAELRNPCPFLARDVALGWDDQLTAQFALNPQCKGVRVLRTTGSLDLGKITIENPSVIVWWLTVGNRPTSLTRSWELSQSHPDRPPDNFLSGQGMVRQVAADICAIVNERGARLR